MNEKKSVGLAVASMVLGIVSLLFGCCFWYVTIPAAVIAVILAAISISKHMGGKGMAISGLVTGIISLVPAIIIMITGSSLMAMVSDDDDAKSKKDISMSSVSDESDSFSHDEKEKSNVSDSKEKTTVKIVDYLIISPLGTHQSATRKTAIRIKERTNPKQGTHQSAARNALPDEVISE